MRPAADAPPPWRVLTPDWPSPAGVRAVCTLRSGGVSQSPYGQLNLGTHVGDDPVAVEANRQRLAQAIQARPVFLQQVHGQGVVALHPDTPDGTEADACWTQTPELACTILVADCLPVLMTDVRGTVVAAAHAGWRGLAQGVLQRTLHAVCEAAQTPPRDVMVWLGPCIGPKAFEVGLDVCRAFGADAKDASADAACQTSPHFRAGQAPDKWFADLPALARQALQQAGVTQLYGNDSSDAWCTVTQSGRFFSYRRDGRTGRFAACIWRTR